MADDGLTPTGFVPETIAGIRAQLEEDLRNTFGASLPLGDETLLGHMIGIIAEQIGLLWERAEQINSSQDPDKATDDALDALCALTGTFRQEATSSVSKVILGGDDGTVIASTSLVATTSTQKQFQLVDDVTLALQATWAPSIAYTVFARVTNSSRCYQCITAGTSAGSGGPTTTADDITDGTVHWQYIGEGQAVGDAIATSVDAGPIVAIAGDLTTIQTPIAGWRSVKNLQDATLGLNRQLDQDLRLTREAELAGSGAGTKDALIASLSKLAGVISASLFVNVTDVTDVNGVPPHAFESLVRGGADQAIVDTIANELPVGIATYGNTTGNHTDSEGVVNAINYSRPTLQNMYAVLFVNYDAASYPGDGDTEIKTSITTWGAGFPTDRDVDPTAAGAQAFATDGVTGVPRVLVFNDVIATGAAWAPTTAYSATVGSRSVVTNDGGRYYICTTAGTSAGSGGPTGTATDIVDGTVHWRFLSSIFVIGLRELAAFDTTRITVHSTAV